MLGMAGRIRVKMRTGRWWWERRNKRKAEIRKGENELMNWKRERILLLLVFHCIILDLTCIVL